MAWLGATAGLAGPQNVEAGPIWGDQHAAERCPQVCASLGGWNGQWWTTVPGEMSVCQCAGAALTEEESRKQFAAHTKKGREFAELQMWREAQAELQAARALRPEDRQVVQEVCWASIQLGDVPVAREACQSALDKASTPNDKARALYHLGRLAEVEAANAYRESLKLQMDPAVAKRLRRLTDERGK